MKFSHCGPFRDWRTNTSKWEEGVGCTQARCWRHAGTLPPERLVVTPEGTQLQLSPYWVARYSPRDCPHVHGCQHKSEHTQT